MTLTPSNPRLAEAMAACDAWTVVESLLPNTYKSPEKLAGRDEADLMMLPMVDNPWLPEERKPQGRVADDDDSADDEDEDEEGDRKPKIHHTVVLASVNMDTASQAVIEAFGELPEGRMPTGWAALATISLDAQGRPAKKTEFIEISSFAWAFPKVLAKAFGALSSWNLVKSEMVDHIANLIDPGDVMLVDDEIRSMPVPVSGLVKASEWLRGRLGIDPKFYDERPFIVRSNGKPDDLIVNSFFIGDIVHARNALSGGHAGDALRKFMRVDTVAKKVTDVFADLPALEGLLHPSNAPAGRWPGGRDLVLLQQAAVNAAKHELAVTGILGVNGPPGTGKTTLLRDVVAMAVVARADAMAEFAWPGYALKDLDLTVNEGTWGEASNVKFNLLAPGLLGHEVLVASSNNGAVENVSRELPMADSVATGRSEGLFPYISDLMANPPKKGQKTRRVAYVPPAATWGLIAAPLGNSGRRAAFARRFWYDEDYGMRTYLRMVTGQKVRIEERDKSDKVIFSRDPAICGIEKPVDGNAMFERWQDAVEAYRMAKDRVAEAVEAAGSGADAGIDSARRDLEAHLADRPAPGPGSIKRDILKRWNLRRAELEARVNGSASGAGVAVDATFFGLDHRSIQTASPWLSPEAQKLREDVFVKAMELHRVFIDVNAAKLLTNLTMAMNNLRGMAGLSGENARIVVPHLWATLSIFVPVVSSTFASIGSMLRNTPIETIGWLLVDEAGQATPQSAVGAVMRAKRALVVGDPLQVAPVVQLPPKLITDLFAHFGLDDEKWASPKVSVQSLADEASPYGAVFGTEARPRPVGLPLLVHRRCDEPMFSICNDVAYNGQMVSMTPQRPIGRISKVLGPSSWLHFETEEVGKWVPSEGDEVVAMLEALRDDGVDCPDISIITPFRDIANSLARLCYRHDGLIDELGYSAHTFVRDRVGTVHTFQGRESEAVILVLGSRGDGQKGARDWAGASVNILNVAVSRAKQNLYVIGDRDAWSEAGTFARLAAAFPE